MLVSTELFERKDKIMSKTLSKILTVFKVARIVAKVVFILCIIGGAGCLLGLSTLPIVGALLTIPEFVEEGLDLPTAYLECIVGAISCAGEAVFAFFAERYFKSVLDAGTPFTFEGAKKSFRLGITSIIISAATAVVVGFASIIIQLFASAVTEADVSTSFSLSTGLFFLFLSLIFKHGAELQAPPIEDTQLEEQKSETESL